MPRPRTRYAEGTRVAPEKSRADIEKLLIKHGATSLATAWETKNGHAVHAIVCKIANRMVRFRIDPPTPDEIKKHRISNVDNEIRRRWRVLLLVIKAKFELAETGASTIEREFLADTLLPNNVTVGDHFLPQIAESYDVGSMPLLPGAR